MTEHNGQKRAGFYIASHPWLGGGQEAHKIGHSGSLGDRLHDGCYVTCFCDEPDAQWGYDLTYEVASKEEAARLEAGMLLATQNKRFGTREVVSLTVAELQAILGAMVAALGIPGELKIKPSYVRTVRSTSGGDEPSGAKGQLLSAEDRVRVRDVLQLHAEAGCTPPPGGADVPEAMADRIRRLKEEGRASVAGCNGIAAGSEAPSSIPVRPAVALPLDTQDDPESEFIDTIHGVSLAGCNGIAGCNHDNSEDAAGNGIAARPIEDRPYQTEAAAACRTELARRGRTVLQMACRCGKTRVAYLVMRPLLDRGERVLFLVPGLSLLRQTALKLSAYGVSPRDILMVGSDAGLETQCPAEELTTRSMVTDPQAILARLRMPGPLLVVSTYHSSQLALDAMRECEGPGLFSLTVFDECHRICGAGEARAFNYALLAPAKADNATNLRLFMTATPRYDVGGAGISMQNQELFGGIAYRYYLRDGIRAGYANDFEVQLVAPPEERPPNELGGASPTGRKKTVWERLQAFFGGGARGPDSSVPPSAEEVLAAQICAAVDFIGGRASPTGADEPHGRPRLLVFCRTIAAAQSLLDLTQAMSRAQGRSETRFLIASSKTPGKEMAEVLSEFNYGRSAAVLFNCRLFQEGVELPRLNGVFFASPRHSPRDIIQSCCRALTWLPGKPRSVIFIPVPAGPVAYSEDGTARPADLGRFASILPYAEALSSEDPRLLEHLIDPERVGYPLGWLGAHGSGEEMLAAARRAIRYGTKESKRPVDRLTRPARLPWKVVFAELRRIVLVCKRYVKNNDGLEFGNGSIKLDAWYRWAIKEYVAYTGGRPSALQPHMVADLESLPAWKTRGIHGPYPFEQSMNYLAEILEKTRGKMPPVEIHRGGWIGLDSTPMEQLSGVLTTVSQRDGRSFGRTGAHSERPKRGFTVKPEEAKRLDEVFGKWGLVWRKARHHPNEEDKASGLPGYLQENEKGEYDGPPTCIQIGYTQFKAVAAQNVECAFIQKHWPGYGISQKHSQQELPEVLAAGLAPPRYAKGGALIKRVPKSVPCQKGARLPVQSVVPLAPPAPVQVI